MKSIIAISDTFKEELSVRPSKRFSEGTSPCSQMKRQTSGHCFDLRFSEFCGAFFPSSPQCAAKSSKNAFSLGVVVVSGLGAPTAAAATPSTDLPSVSLRAGMRRDSNANKRGAPHDRGGPQRRGVTPGAALSVRTRSRPSPRTEPVGSSPDASKALRTPRRRRCHRGFSKASVSSPRRAFLPGAFSSSLRRGAALIDGLVGRGVVFCLEHLHSSAWFTLEALLSTSKPSTQQSRSQAYFCDVRHRIYRERGAARQPRRIPLVRASRHMRRRRAPVPRDIAFTSDHSSDNVPVPLHTSAS